MSKPSQSDNQRYLERKAFFDKLLTIYGRKAVLEALQDSSLNIYRLHLADSNRPAAILDEMLALAQQRGIEVVYHNKQALSRISKNAKQDQGVAADIQCPLHGDIATFLEQEATQAQPLRLLALDGVTNPQNVGMIIRSAAAGGVHGLILPRKGTADIGPLVIKASAGTLFKQPIIRCDSLADTVNTLRQLGFDACCLAADARQSLFDYAPEGDVVYVLGSESEGVSKAVRKQCNHTLHIPMSNDVESLNVAVTAALIAYQPATRR